MNIRNDTISIFQWRDKPKKDKASHSTTDLTSTSQKTNMGNHRVTIEEKLDQSFPVVIAEITAINQ